MSDGRSWAARARARHAGLKISRAMAEQQADMHTSNYYNKGIKRAGCENLYEQGFVAGALGGQ